MTSRTAAAFGVYASLIIGAAGCTDPAKSRPNLLLVTLDTTRADHLGCYGDRTADTPRLDRLAREGLLVEQAIAVAPLTLPSHTSILTGLYPPRHGVRDNADFRLPESETTLAEHLRTQGYATAAVVASYVLSSTLGLPQGFETYDEPKAMAGGAAAAPVLERSAAEVTDAAIRALDRVGGKSFFLWVHYYDPHVPYAPPEAYAKRFAGRLYDGEIAYADAQLGRLLDDLSRRGLLDRTLVVAIGDHGESLGDHGESTHGIFVYDAAIHVPLLLRLPGTIPGGTRSNRLVSGVDIVSTVLEMMALPPMPGVEGKSFATSARGGSETPRDPVYAESTYPERAYGWAPLFSLRDAASKFIDAPEPELYEIGVDPVERVNLAATRPEDVRRWKSLLDAAVEAIGTADPSAQNTMDEEARQKLASLGYVSSGSGRIHRTSHPDPKRIISVNEKFVRAQALSSEGRAAEAFSLLGEALAIDPENPAVIGLSGTLSFWSLNERERGLRQLESAVRLAPGIFELQWNLANAFQLSGRLPEAAQAYRAALGLQPQRAEAHLRLGMVLYAMKDARGALREYNEAKRLGLDSPDLRAALGVGGTMTEGAADGEAGLRAAVRANPSLTDAWNKLGLLASRAGRREEAREHYAKALAADPDNREALFNHARLSMLLEDTEAAARDIDRLAAKYPDYPATRYLKAHLLAQGGDAEGARAALRELLAHPEGADPKLMESAKELLKKLGG